MKAKPGQISVATAGVTSAGHNAMESISQGHRRQVPPRHLRRRQPGGRGHGGRRGRRDDAAGRGAGRHDPRQAPAPAGHGERQAARARGLRHDPAAVADAARASPRRPTTSASSFRRACPTTWSKTVEKIWAEQIANSDALKKYAQPAAARSFAPQYRRRDAQKAVFPAVQANAWLLFDGGKAKVSPGHRGHPEALKRLVGPRRVRDVSHRRSPAATDDGRADPRRAPTSKDSVWLDRVRRRGADRLAHDGPARAAAHQSPYTVPGLLPGAAGHRDDPARRHARACAAGGAVRCSSRHRRPCRADDASSGAASGS